MALYEPVSQLTRRRIIFPLSLVLFEFATYIAHDMIQPGMLLVTEEFGAGPEWVSASLTAYLIGGMMLQWAAFRSHWAASGTAQRRGFFYADLHCHPLGAEH